jgi:hypothetical protein
MFVAKEVWLRLVKTGKLVKHIEAESSHKLELEALRLSTM